MVIKACHKTDTNCLSKSFDQIRKAFLLHVNRGRGHVDWHRLIQAHPVAVTMSYCLAHFTRYIHPNKQQNK